MQMIYAFLLGCLFIAVSALAPHEPVAQYEEPPLLPPLTGTALVAPDANVIDRTAPLEVPDANGQPDADDAGDGADD